MFNLLRASTSVKTTVAAAAAAVVLSAALVSQTTSAAFSDDTDNGVNTWNAGAVALTDDDSNTAMFNVSNMKPGDTAERCIRVTNSSTVANRVAFYVSDLAQTNNLLNTMTFVIDEGTGGGTFGSCSGFTASAQSFNGAGTGLASHTTYETAFSAWTHNGGAPADRVYRVRYTLPSSADNSVANGTASLRFVWESRSGNFA